MQTMIHQLIGFIYFRLLHYEGADIWYYSLIDQHEHTYYANTYFMFYHNILYLKHCHYKITYIKYFKKPIDTLFKS